MKYFTGLPLDGDPRVTGRFGQSTGFWTPSRPHRGIDYGVPAGTPIYYRGLHRATVIKAHHEPSGDFGIHCRLLLNELEDVWALYAHMERLAPDLVNGFAVYPGDVLGWIGHTGMATGDHLHWQCYHDGPGASLDIAKSVDPESLIGEDMADATNSILVMERDLRRLINGKHPIVPKLHKFLRDDGPSWPGLDFEYEGDYKEVGL